MKIFASGKAVLVGATVFLFSFSIQAALYIRDLDNDWSNGHEGVYDDVLNITWLGSPSAKQGFSNANGYIAGLNSQSLFGYSGWRMPNLSAALPQQGIDPSNFYYDGQRDRGYQISAPISDNNPWGKSSGETRSELAYHYYNNFGGWGAMYGTQGMHFFHENSNQVGIENARNTENLALFSNVDGNFWYPVYKSDRQTNQAWYFDMSDYFAGIQDTTYIGGAAMRAWAVHDGDIGAVAGAVPIPAAIWLFGSGIIGLLGMQRFKSID